MICVWQFDVVVTDNKYALSLFIILLLVLDHISIQKLHKFIQKKRTVLCEHCK